MVTLILVIAVLAAVLLLARMAFRSSDTDTHFAGFGVHLDITRQRLERQSLDDDPSRADELR
jgi:hypothetical protein